MKRKYTPDEGRLLSAMRNHPVTRIYNSSPGRLFLVVRGPHCNWPSALGDALEEGLHPAPPKPMLTKAVLTDKGRDVIAARGITRPSRDSSHLNARIRAERARERHGPASGALGVPCMTLCRADAYRHHAVGKDSRMKTIKVTYAHV